jgi:hypothetical protein
MSQNNDYCVKAFQRCVSVFTRVVSNCRHLKLPVITMRLYPRYFSPARFLPSVITVRKIRLIRVW